MARMSDTVWKGATIGILFFSLAIFLIQLFGNLTGAGILLYGSISAWAGILLIALCATIAVAIVQILGRMPWHYQAALAAAFIISIFFMPIATWTLAGWTLAIVVVCPSLLGAALAALLVQKHRGSSWKKQCALMLGILLPAYVLGYAIYWLLSAGAADTSASYDANTPKGTLNLPNPSLPGPYQIKQIFYGSGKDSYRPHFGLQAAIKTPSVDGSAFIEGWDGWTGMIRTYFWGFDSTALPLNAQVWYPDGEGPFPLVLMVHGNHTMSDFSDSGYHYLGSLLASQGFITVSVDENFLNTNFFDRWSSFDEVPARGWLLLKHLALWKEWSLQHQSPFFNKVDMENIGLIGHSRGGEAIVTAEAFNQLPYFPDDGTIAFDFHFSIKALAAIAPKDGQYLPTGVATPLKNINYFVMHGSHDGDVRSFEGTKTYSRIAFNDDNYWFKAALYIVGANHGQFNEVWDRADADLPDLLFLNLAPLLSNVQQHRIAEVYLSAFFQSTLKKRTDYIPLFWDARLGGDWLPSTLFLNQFEDSKTAFIYSNKKDLDLSTMTLPGTTLSQNNLTVWRQQAVSLKRGDKLDSAIFAGWKDGKGDLIITLPVPNPLPITEESVLTFSLADANEASEKDDVTHKPYKGLIDLTIELTDLYGERAALPLSQESYLFPQIQTEVYKASFLNTIDNSEVIFQTFRFPLAAFLKENEKFSARDVHQVRFIFNRTPSGVVIIDRIGVEPPFKSI